VEISFLLVVVYPVDGRFLVEISFLLVVVYPVDGRFLVEISLLFPMSRCNRTGRPMRGLGAMMRERGFP
jgi:hypothetical protein